MTACGGDVAGTWQIDSGCLSLKSPFTQPECQAIERGAEYVATGTVTYAISSSGPQQGQQGMFQPSFSFRYSATEVYSPSCLSALGFQPGTMSACEGLQALWAGPFLESCVVVQGGCECSFADQQNFDQATPFATSAGQIVISSTDGQSTDAVDYCRTGTTLVESTATDASVSRFTLHLRDP